VAVRDAVFDPFGFYLPHGTQIIGYPIAGPGNDLRPGHRRYNFVWYAPVAEAEIGRQQERARRAAQRRFGS
jgi:hypothetical protein